MDTKLSPKNDLPVGSPISLPLSDGGCDASHQQGMEDFLPGLSLISSVVKVPFLKAEKGKSQKRKYIVTM
jgi:hypothetical protein